MVKQDQVKPKNFSKDKKKHFKNKRKNEEEEQEQKDDRDYLGEEFRSDSDDNESMDSEEEALLKMKQKHPDNEDVKNKLKLGQFHRFTNDFKKDKKRQPSTKKKIRDLERFIAREGLPEDIKQAKQKELKDLKKQEKAKSEAEKFELRYKKIKFFGTHFN